MRGVATVHMDWKLEHYDPRDHVCVIIYHPAAEAAAVGFSIFSNVLFISVQSLMFGGETFGRHNCWLHAPVVPTYVEQMRVNSNYILARL